MIGKTKLSICMIVKDEEGNLERCLDSLLPIIIEPDVELIIVDTGSKDRTVQVAEKHFATVYKKEFKPFSFCNARNYGIDKAVGERILIMDADEEIPQASLYHLKDLIYNPEYKQPTFFFWMNDRYADDNIVYSEWIQPRLFNRIHNGKRFHYEKDVHNRPVTSQPYLVCNDIKINHYGYKFYKKDVLNRKINDRSLPMMEAGLKKNPKDLHLLAHMIKTLRSTGDSDRIIKLGKTYMDEFDKIEYHDGWFAYLEGFISLVDAYVKKEDLLSALAVYERAKKFSGKLIGIPITIGHYYFENKDIDKAIPYYEEVIQIARQKRTMHEQLMANNIKMILPGIFRILATYNFHKGNLLKAGQYTNEGIKNSVKFTGRWDIWNCDMEIEDAK